MPSHPKIDGAPGLQWPRRADGWVATWVARRDIVERGYNPKTQRLWPPSGEPWSAPDEATAKYIQSECQRLQDEMLGWARGNGGLPRAFFTGTMKSLIDCYREDEDSPYQRLRPKSRRVYNSHLNMLIGQVGDRALRALTGRDFLRWFEAWAADSGRRRVSRAHARMTMVRVVMGFGVVMEYKHCKRLRDILEAMKFQGGKSRTVIINAEQAIAVRLAAHAAGRPSVALAQAIQYELMLRQKDVIGEWMPTGEPGISAVTEAGHKWLIGIDWREVSPSLILTHRLSKSLRGRDAVTDPDAGKVKTFDLTLYPMVMEELKHVPPERRSGPMIVNEATGLPFREGTYRNLWRDIARAAGVPDNVQNRDSRAGGITEGIVATGGDLVAVRDAAGHSRVETTQIYTRSADQQTAKVAVLRSTRTDSKRP